MSEWFGGDIDYVDYIKQIQHPWEDWFAWYPVTTISGHRIWLKKISRRTVMKYGDQRLNMEWEYGTLFDILKEV